MDETTENVVALGPLRATPRGVRSEAAEPPPAGSSRGTTLVLAELRGWWTVVDRLGPGRPEEVLAGCIEEGLHALASFGGLDVTLAGDPRQPVLAARFEGPEHTLRALQAATALRAAVAGAQEPAPPGEQLHACIGVSTGDVTETTLGPGVRVRSVGTIRLLAARLQEFAGPGQVFLCVDTFRRAAECLRVQPLGEVRVNPWGERREAFCLLEIVPQRSPGPPS